MNIPILAYFFTAEHDFALLQPLVWLILLIPLSIPTVLYWQHKMSTKVAQPTREHRKIFISLAAFTGRSNWLILILLVSAASQPVTIHNDTRSIPIQSANVILLDISPSMQEYLDTNDLAQHGKYIDLAKTQISKILNQPNLLFSLIVFSDQATILVPLTLDTYAVQQTLDLARIEASNAQTSITQGLLLGIDVLHNYGLSYTSSFTSGNTFPKRIILFSDGQNNADINRLAQLNQQLEQNNIELVIYLFHPLQAEVLANLQMQLPNAKVARDIPAHITVTEYEGRIHPWAKITHHYPIFLGLALLILLMHWSHGIYRQFGINKLAKKP